MKQPHVLVIEAAPAIGGSLTSIEVVMRKGMAEGMRFSLMSRFDSRSFVPEGVTHAKLPVGQGRRSVFTDLVATRQQLRRGQYDLVLLNNLFSANFPSFVAASVSGLPVIQLVRAYERASKSWRCLSRFVDAFVPVSTSVGDVLRELGVNESKLHLAHEGIALRQLPKQAEVQQLRKRWGIPTGAKVLGFVGRLVPWKGYDLFLDAAIDSALRYEELNVVVVGATTPDSASDVREYMARIDALGLADRFHFTGGVKPEEARELFATFDLFAHCSVTPEPFGRVLLEAMGAGVATISTAKGGPEEIIEHGVDGLRVSPYPKALCHAIDTLLQRPLFAETLGRKGRETVAQRFHEGVCAAPVLSLIRSLAAL